MSTHPWEQKANDFMEELIVDYIPILEKVL